MARCCDYYYFIFILKLVKSFYFLLIQIMFLSRMAIRLKMVDSFRNDEASQLRWLIQAQLQTNLFMEIVEFILTEKKYI